MTHRDLAICKAILDYLHDLDGGQAGEITIHASACERFMAVIPKTEFDAMFKHCQVEGWLFHVPTKFKGSLWSISASGELARQQMT